MQLPSCFLKTLQYIVVVLRIASHSLEPEVAWEGYTWSVVPCISFVIKGSYWLFLSLECAMLKDPI